MKVSTGQFFKDKTNGATYIVAEFCAGEESSQLFYRLININTGRRYSDDNKDIFGGDKEDFEKI